mmetsp:Transcript_14325/g.18096  ORF Transcript_14325/g.18096 Transcript_14325/m.18096 type:complete len:93 (+) Transcript_14325:570-848(+)
MVESIDADAFPISLTSSLCLPPTVDPLTGYASGGGGNDGAEGTDPSGFPTADTPPPSPVPPATATLYPTGAAMGAAIVSGVNGFVGVQSTSN